MSDTAQAGLQAQLSSFEPRPFHPCDQNPKRYICKTKPAIQRWARSAPPTRPSLLAKPQIHQRPGELYAAQWAHCRRWGNTIIVTIFPFRWKKKHTHLWLPVTFWEVCGFFAVVADIMRRNVGGSRTPEVEAGPEKKLLFVFFMRVSRRPDHGLCGAGVTDLITPWYFHEGGSLISDERNGPLEKFNNSSLPVWNLEWEIIFPLGWVVQSKDTVLRRERLYYICKYSFYSFPVCLLSRGFACHHMGCRASRLPPRAWHILGR